MYYNSTHDPYPLFHYFKLNNPTVSISDLNRENMNTILQDVLGPNTDLNNIDYSQLKDGNYDYVGWENQYFY